uniref:Uncharacterized protein n=1 Tax=Glossina pallidipes TaxID=7398 RepID=A0A1A9ZVX5_GLOPL
MYHILKYNYPAEQGFLRNKISIPCFSYSKTPFSPRQLIETKPTYSTSSVVVATTHHWSFTDSLKFVPVYVFYAWILKVRWSRHKTLLMSFFWIVLDSLKALKYKKKMDKFISFNFYDQICLVSIHYNHCKRISKVTMID